MMVASYAGIFLIPMPSGSFLTCLEFQAGERPICAIVLPKGRIYVAVNNGHFTTFQVPEEFREDFTNVAEGMKKESGVTPKTAFLGKVTSGNPQVVKSNFGSRKLTRKDYEDSEETVEPPELMIEPQILN